MTLSQTKKSKNYDIREFGNLFNLNIEVITRQDFQSWVSKLIDIFSLIFSIDNFSYI